MTLDERTRIRYAVLEAIIESYGREDDQNLNDLFADVDTQRYVALQYSNSDKGNVWYTLGSGPGQLIKALSDEAYWYSPHEIYDLDTGHLILLETTTVITGYAESTFSQIVNAWGGEDLEQFYGIEDADPQGPRGRCDSCGAPVNAGGCMNDPTHNVTQET